MKIFILPPEAGDGQQSSVVTDINDLVWQLKEWSAEALAGDSMTIEVKEMTEEEINALPDL